MWLYNQALLPQLSTLTDEGTWGSGSTDEGVSPVPMWDWGGPGQYPRLCGRPAIASEYCAAAGTEGDLILTDLSQYAIAFRQRFAYSAHVQFLTDQNCFRFVWSFDGSPIWASALTPDNGTDTLSPIVTLADRT